MERLAKTIPKAKLIMLTRDPVKRLLSHLNMDMRAERLPRTEVLDVDWLRLHILNRPYRFKKYVERGLYLKQIEENVLPFFPRERLLVRSTEETAAAIDRESLVQGKNRGQLRGTTTSDAHASLVGDVCEFLGIDPPPSALNAIRGTRKYVFVVDPEAEQLLVDIYGADEAGSVERTG